MVQVIPMPSRGSLLGEALGTGFQQGFVPAIQEQRQYEVNRSRLQDALQKVNGLAQQENVTPYDLTSALIGATAGIPGSERYVGTLLQTLLPQLQAKQAQKVDYQPGGAKGRGEEFLQNNRVAQRGTLPQFAGAEQAQENAFYPNNIGPQGGPGNAPQAATEGNKRPIKGTKELLAEGREIAAQQTAAGTPTTPLQGYEIAQKLNDETKEYNKNVDEELKQRVASQQKYGEKAVHKLEKLFPEATDEQKAYFAKKGEDVSLRGKSEADIDRYLAKEATNFKNLVSNVKNSIPAQRSYNMPKQAFLGVDRNFEKRKNDLKLKLDPLLKEGLFDTARNLLSQVGYYPEETESIVGNLSEDAFKKIAQMPKIAKETTSKKVPAIAGSYIEKELPYTDEQKKQVKDTLEDVLTNDPNSNLILLRRGIEEKNGDWRLFKDTVNELIQEGKFSPNQDQFNHFSDLDEPPLTELGKIFHEFGFIGR